MSSTSYVPAPSAASWNRSVRNAHAYCKRIGRCTGRARAPHHTIFDVGVEYNKVVTHLFLVKNSRCSSWSRLTQNASLLRPLAKIREFEWFLYLLGWASLTVTCLRCPVWLVPANSGLCLLACAFLAAARASSFPFSGSPLAVSASCLLGCGWLCAFLIVAITALSLNPPWQAAKIKNAYFWLGRRRPKTRNLPATEGSGCQAQKWKKLLFLDPTFPRFRNELNSIPFGFWTWNAFKTHFFSILARCPPLVPACLRLSGRYLSASSFFFWLVSRRLGFVPAGLRVSGCRLPALSCPARFRPSVVPTCLAGRLWLYLACVVLSGSFLAVSGLYLLGRVSLAVACLLCPVWLVSVAVCASYLLGWASLAVTCLRCPVWLVSCRLLFVPAWWGVSGCCLPVLPCPARFRRSAVPTCLAGRLWLFLSRRLWFVPACLRVSGHRARLLFSFFWLASRRFSVVPAWLRLALHISDRCNHCAVSEPALTGSQNKKRVFLTRPAAPENAKPACYWRFRVSSAKMKKLLFLDPLNFQTTPF